MVLDFLGVVREGSKPAGTIPPGMPTAYPIIWPRGEDGRLRLTVKKQDLTAFDLTGATVIFAVRLFSNETLPTVSRQASIIDAAAGRADVVLVPADTLGLVDGYEYSYDVQLTDAAGKRWQIVPRSSFRVDPIYAQPGEDVTVPVAEAPLALGPSWLELSEADELQTDTTTAEQLALEGAWNFDDVTGALGNLFLRLAGIARVSGGVGVVRVRIGGTVGAVNGTAALALVVSGTAEAVVTSNAAVLKPTGTQLVKVTLQNDTAGQQTFLRGVTLRARGAV